MCNALDRVNAFCIWRIIDSHMSPTSSLIFFSTSFEQPLRTSDDVILIDLVLIIIIIITITIIIIIIIIIIITIILILILIRKSGSEIRTFR